MRRTSLLILAVLAVACTGRAPVLLTNAGDDTMVAKGTTYRWTFDEHVPLPGTGVVAVPPERTFVGVLGRWGIAKDRDAPSPPGVYRQDRGFGPTDQPRVLVSELAFRDPAVRVSCRPDSGTAGEGCGLVFDALGSEDYFVVRADALEGVVRLVHVHSGEEREVASAPAPVTPHVWHSMSVRTHGERVVVDWDGVRVLDAVDWARTGGKIGLATTADAVTSFDDLEVVAE